MLYPDKALYFIYVGPGISSRTAVYIHELKERGFDVKTLKTPKLMSLDTFKLIQDLIRKRDCSFVVCATSQILTPIVFLCTGKLPILDAGWPLSDGVSVSRREFGVLGLRFVKFFLVDFFAFHSAKAVFLESQQQLQFVRYKFLTRPDKLILLYTGLDEQRFRSKIHRVSKCNSISNSKIQILFRGGNQDEAGLQVLQRAIVEGVLSREVKFIVITKDSGFKISDPRVTLIHEHISDESLENLYLSSSLILGQMSNHVRLSRTIPHKFFEAAFLGLPYLSANVGPMEEFASRGLIEGFTPGSYIDLSETINRLIMDTAKLQELGNRLHRWYIEESSQKILGEKFIKSVSCGD